MLFQCRGLRQKARPLFGQCIAPRHVQDHIPAPSECLRPLASQCRRPGTPAVARAGEGNPQTIAIEGRFIHKRTIAMRFMDARPFQCFYGGDSRKDATICSF